MTSGDQVGRELAGFEARLQRVERGLVAPQLSHSSIEDSWVPMYDQLGALRARLGKQSDGTFAVTYQDGPQPPACSAPVVTAHQLAIVVYWDGLDATGAAMPADVQRVDVHASETAGFVADGTTVVTSLPAEGAESFVADNMAHYVRIVAVTTSDVASAATAEVEVTPLPVRRLEAGSIDGMTIRGVGIYGDNLFTAETGRRIGLEGASNALVAYDDQGVEVGSTVSFATTMRTSGAPDAAGRTGVSDVSETLALLQFADPEIPSTTWRSRVEATENYTGVTAGDGAGATLSQIYAEQANGGDVAIVGGGVDTLFALSNAVGNPHGRAQLYGNGSGSSVVFESGRLSAESLTNDDYVPVLASAFTVSSGRAGKTDVRELSLDPVAALRAAPVREWSYTSDVAQRDDPPPRPPVPGPDGRPVELDPGPPRRVRRHIGPMVEDLPDTVTGPADEATGAPTLDIGGLLGLTVAAVAQLADRVDALDAAIGGP